MIIDDYHYPIWEVDDSAVPNAKLYGGNKQRAQNNVNCLLFVKFRLFL